MHILVTNDDGVQAPGLLALAQSMRSLGKVSVLAPDHNWSASGHVKTLHRPLRARETLLADGTPALTSDGAPSDCVALALLGLIEKPVDLVVSGINPYANVGHDLTYSGTVTAAMEAAIAGIPAIAFSIDGSSDSPTPPDYACAAEIAQRVAALLLKNGLPDETLLNVNIPNRPFNEIQGYLVTRQGLRIYRDELVKRLDPRGRPYYWIGGDVPTGVPEDDSDIGALAGGFVSITPIHLDLTAHQLLTQIRRWDWKA
ncbi:MAG TPA: 5'/3'-nucleotidase SurE [Anaerolineaceae bacterium]|nr:5'/3'-nucleotidase SurE [Anaerolineaceae bacterium]